MLSASFTLNDQTILPIKEFRCYEVKMEESEKRSAVAGSRTHAGHQRHDRREDCEGWRLYMQSTYLCLFITLRLLEVSYTVLCAAAYQRK